MELGKKTNHLCIDATKNEKKIKYVMKAKILTLSAYQKQNIFTKFQIHAKTRVMIWFFKPIESVKTLSRPVFGFKGKSS